MWTISQSVQKKESDHSLIFFHASWINNEHEVFLNMGKWEIGSGKQILWLACPKGKLEFKFLSSPE